MELKAKDLYRVQCADFISQNSITSLMSFYQPLITADGICLYLTLIAEGRNQKTPENHSRLSLLANMSIDALERARIHLEEMLLVRTYVQEGKADTSYLYVLQAPLSVQGFLNNQEFMNLYAHAVGTQQAEYSLSKFTRSAVQAGYKDVTRPVIHRPAERNFPLSEPSSQIQPRYDFNEDEIAINFDYERFFATTSTLVFPAELRTQENLRLIGKLATLYGLSSDRMRILVSRVVSISAMTFDAEKLKVLAAACQPDITSAKDPYSLPPVSFLQAKQSGAEVSMTDKKILERLSVGMHFSTEVINIMIEYILRVSSNRLIPVFVDSVAGEWARDGIKTRQQAVDQAKKKFRSAGRSAAVMPAYYEMLKDGKEPAQKEASEKEKQEVLNMMKEMGDKHAEG